MKKSHEKARRNKTFRGGESGFSTIKNVFIKRKNLSKSTHDLTEGSKKDLNEGSKKNDLTEALRKDLSEILINFDDFEDDRPTPAHTTQKSVGVEPLEISQKNVDIESNKVDKHASRPKSLLFFRKKHDNKEDKSPKESPVCELLPPKSSKSTPTKRSGKIPKSPTKESPRSEEYSPSFEHMATTINDSQLMSPKIDRRKTPLDDPGSSSAKLRRRKSERGKKKATKEVEESKIGVGVDLIRFDLDDYKVAEYV